MPLIYAIQQVSNKLKFLVQAANDVYLIRLEDFIITIWKSVDFSDYAIWSGTVGRLKLWKTYKTLLFYLCVKGIDFASFYDFDIWYWNCSDSLIKKNHFIFIIIFNWNSRLAVNDTILHVQSFMSDAWLQNTSKMFYFK